MCSGKWAANYVLQLLDFVLAYCIMAGGIMAYHEVLNAQAHPLCE
jgi:hypothetical protein